MSMCERMSELMPAVAAGRSEWAGEEAAHLESCTDCAAEWALVRTASRMGRGVTVDDAVILPRLLESMRESRRSDRRRAWLRRSMQLGGLAIAAVLLLMLVPRKPTAPATPGATVAIAEAAPLQLAELDDAAPSDLEMVLVEFDEPAVPASSLDAPDLEGLDMSQVERALRSWEES